MKYLPALSIIFLLLPHQLLAQNEGLKNPLMTSGWEITQGGGDTWKLNWRIKYTQEK